MVAVIAPHTSSHVEVTKRGSYSFNVPAVNPGAPDVCGLTMPNVENDRHLIADHLGWFDVRFGSICAGGEKS